MTMFSSGTKRDSFGGYTIILRSEVPAGRAQDDDAAAGHVFAAVIAHALDHRDGAAVPDGEALAGDAAEIRLSARRPIERDVADDDVLFGDEARQLRRIHDHL